MSPRNRFTRSGFTLIEMTVVIVVGMGIASAGMLLLSQQIRVIEILNRQNFILEDAPQINHSITSILSRADAIRLHSSFDDALADSNAVIADGTVLVAAFRNIDETTTFGIISFEENDDDDRLNYYFYDPTEPQPTVGNPSWTIARTVAGVNFSTVDGLVQLQLTGPNAEEITYTISPNQ
jgi:prepilin-type N-terminal cleavage/methylation domain-containing protein